MTSRTLRIRIFVALLGLTVFTLGGCPSAGGSITAAATGVSDTLTTFVEDFARHLLAAWLL